MRRSDEPLDCERDRRPRATQGRHRECRSTKVDHSVAIVDCIENFYNPRRRHGSLSYFTPEEFENLQLSETQAALA
jgi:transposase InsO family protein